MNAAREAVPEAEPLDEGAMWRAVEARDPAFDGRFLLGVVTTGIYCRPSCPARRPLRRNARFFATAPAAERAGLRPCLRCRPTEAPEDARVAIVRRMCDLIRERCDDGPSTTLSALARRSGYGATHVTRLFRAILGLTPRQLVEACRLEALKGELRGTSAITSAIYGAGFGSASRVYERVDGRLGMTPGAYRAGGKGEVIAHVELPTDLGPVLVGATDRGICFVQFGDSPRERLEALRREFPQARLEPAAAGDSPQLRRWAEALSAHLRGRRPHADLPLDVSTTAFRFQVYRYLATIPRGETRTYSEVAQAIGRPGASRAVASACAANTVAVLIPCHRVIRAGGELAGYRWGVDRKRRLLAAERRAG